MSSGESIWNVIDEMLREISSTLKDVLNCVNSIKASLDGQFTILCPNCRSPISIFPIPYFMVKSIHEVDAPDSQMRQVYIGIPSERDWKELKVICKKCEKVWHVCYC